MNRFAVAGLAAALVATLAVFLWTTSHYRSPQGERPPDTWVDERGHLHVLGLVLGETTLRQAEEALRSRSETGLYHYPGGEDGTLKIEAYFPSIADHSKVILRLEADRPTLERMAARADDPTRFPGGVVRLRPHAEDAAAAGHLPVVELTLVPSIEITPDMLKARFGPPARTRREAPAAEGEPAAVHHLYPDIGLDARLEPGKKSTLHFVQPAAFGDGAGAAR